MSNPGIENRFACGSTSARGARRDQLSGGWGRDRRILGSYIDNPVHQLPAVGLRRRNRVEHEFAAKSAANCHGGSIAPGFAERRTPPHGNAVPAGRALIGIKPATPDRVDAVTTDEDIRARRLAVSAIHRVREVGRDPGLILDETGKPACRFDRIRSQPFDHRIEQNFLQSTPVNGELRDIVSGAKSARFAPDFLAGLGEVIKFRRPYSDGVEGIEQTQSIEFLDGVGQNIDADTDLAHF